MKAPKYTKEQELSYYKRQRLILLLENDMLKRHLDDIQTAHAKIVFDECAKDEKHCSCVPVLRRQIAILEQTIREIKDPNCKPLHRRF